MLWWRRMIVGIERSYFFRENKISVIDHEQKCCRGTMMNVRLTLIERSSALWTSRDVLENKGKHYAVMTCCCSSPKNHWHYRFVFRSTWKVRFAKRILFYSNDPIQPISPIGRQMVNAKSIDFISLDSYLSGWKRKSRYRRNRKDIIRTCVTTDSSVNKYYTARETITLKGKFGAQLFSDPHRGQINQYIISPWRLAIDVSCKKRSLSWEREREGESACVC